MNCSPSPAAAPVVRILLFGGYWPVAGAIHKATYSPFAHVAVRIGDDVYEAVIPRVIKRRYDPKGRDRAAIELAPPPSCDLSASSVERARAWLSAQVGKPYDYLACAFDAIGYLMRPAFGDRAILQITGRDYWNCSRLTGAALGQMGWRHAGIDREPTPISPGDVARFVAAETADFLRQLRKGY